MNSPSEIPHSLLLVLLQLFNSEIANGDTYPQEEQLTEEQFVQYWFQRSTVILLQTDKLEIKEDIVWEDLVVGIF